MRERNREGGGERECDGVGWGGGELERDKQNILKIKHSICSLKCNIKCNNKYYEIINSYKIIGKNNVIFYILGKNKT